MFLVVGVAVAVVLDFMTLIPVKLSSTISLRNVSFQWKFFTQQRVVRNQHNQMVNRISAYF